MNEQTGGQLDRAIPAARRQPQVRAVGGPGKEYWVDDPGMNVATERINGHWRIEISPPRPAGQRSVPDGPLPLRSRLEAPFPNLSSDHQPRRLRNHVAASDTKFSSIPTATTGGTFECGRPLATTPECLQAQLTPWGAKMKANPTLVLNSQSFSRSVIKRPIFDKKPSCDPCPARSSICPVP